MERIVNGHYADPNSTRDIIGITPQHFETLIIAVQQYHQSMQMMLSATPEERKAFFEVGLKTVLDDPDCSADKIEDSIKKNENEMIEHYNRSYEILAAINQPYPGADYGGPSPQNN